MKTICIIGMVFLSLILWTMVFEVGKVKCRLDNIEQNQNTIVQHPSVDMNDCLIKIDSNEKKCAYTYDIDVATNDAIWMDINIPDSNVAFSWLQDVNALQKIEVRINIDGRQKDFTVQEFKEKL